MRTGTVITGIIATVLVIAGFIIISKKDNAPDQNTATSPPAASEQSTDASNTADQPPAAAAVITYNGSLFSPSQVTVNKGDTITVKNESSTIVDFESDVHPIHTDNPELNVGEIALGQSKSFTVNTVGSWGYHNHLNETQTGTIIVR